MTGTPGAARSRACLMVLAALLAGGCMTRPPAPVSERAPLAPPPPPAMAPSVEREHEHEAPPVPTYTVKRGDTLAQIALDNGLDYRELASWNGLDNPNVIRVGQVLVLAAPGSTPSAPPAPGTVVTTPLAGAPPAPPKVAEPATSQGAPMLPSGRGNTATLKAEPRAVKVPYSEQALAQMQAHASTTPPPAAVVAAAPATIAAPATSAPPAAPAPAPAAPASAPTSTLPARPDAARVPEIDDDKLGWIWPTQGKVIAPFSDSKGIDIGGKAGQPVVASAAGRVVYAGSGLRGYGKLVIVKHNSTFLSAYAHNRELVVKEGQQVTKGQKISEMGDTDADQVKLHFEIRRLGKPVDPIKFLPPA